MNELLNLAIIGGSINSTIGDTHIKTINSTGKFKIVCGFFSRNKKINQLSGHKYNIPKNKTYSSLKELIKNEKQNIDIAVVLTPPNTRNKIFKDLINNNINIISEKPLESNLTKAKEIYKNITKKKIFFASTYNYLGYPAIMEIKPLVENKIGKILNFIIEMSHQTFILKKTKIKKWRLKDNEIPNLYLDLASHLISLILYFFNKYPTELKSFSSKKNKFNVVDNSYVWLKFKKFYGNLWFSKNSAGQRNNLTIRIFGSKGSIVWDHKKSESINLYDDQGNMEIIDRLSNKGKYIKNSKLYTYAAGHPNGFLDAFHNTYISIYELFMKSKKNNSLPMIIQEKESLKILSILEKIHTSSKKNNWVKTNIK